jgi:hypothetical protein
MFALVSVRLDPRAFRHAPNRLSNPLEEVVLPQGTNLELQLMAA